MLDDIQRFVTGAEPTLSSNRVLATLVFTDIVGSTERLGQLSDRVWTTLAEAHDEAVRSIVERFGGRVVDTAGDGVFALFDGPSRGLDAAVAIRKRTADLGLNVRVGVHTGEVELAGASVRGVAVHTAARVLAQAEEGGIVVSRIVRDLLNGSQFRFEPLGSRRLKGLIEPMDLFATVET
jgi:class 3 adenylate cyclase